MSQELGETKVSLLDERAAAALGASFSREFPGKSPEQFRHYLRQHHQGEITVLVARLGDEVAGYLKIAWEPSYPPLRERGVPEIQDLNVLPHLRRRGIASQLLDDAEKRVAERSPVVGIGVGLHPGYNAAQRLYVLRGYVPDGHGVTYDDRFVEEGEQVPVDDALVLYFERHLR